MGAWAVQAPVVSEHPAVGPSCTAAHPVAVTPPVPPSVQVCCHVMLFQIWLISFLFFSSFPFNLALSEPQQRVASETSCKFGPSSLRRSVTFLGSPASTGLSPGMLESL